MTMCENPHPVRTIIERHVLEEFTSGNVFSN